MTQQIGTFDFRNLKVVLGAAEIKGYSEGEAVSISEEKDAFDSTSGADGYTDRVKVNSNFLNITLKIRQTSPTNDVLSALHIADRLAGTPLPLYINDAGGNSLFTAAQAWIVGFPKDISYGDGVQERVWTIKTGSTYLMNLGGNK